MALTGFRQKQIIRRFSDGLYVKGRWVSGGTAAEIEVSASVQPANNNDMQNLPEGKRIERTVKIYTDAVLKVEGTDSVGDVLLWQGREYRVIAVAPHLSGVISHYRYYAVTGIES